MGTVEAALEPRPLTRWKVVLLFSPLVVMAAVKMLFVNPAAPWLLKHHPLALIALDGRNRNLLLASARTEVVAFIVFAVLARMLTDPVHYLIGRVFGDRALIWLRKQFGEKNRFIGWIERSFHKAGGVMVFAMPGAPVCLMAGITGMKLRRFLFLNLAGTLTVVLLLRGMASALKAPLEAALNFNDKYVGVLTPIFIGLTVIWIVHGRIKRKRAGAAGAGGELGMVIDLTEMATAPAPVASKAAHPAPIDG